MPHDVFISYSSKDQAVAESLCAAIEERGSRAWMAPRNILPGQDYGEAIIDAISASRLMVIVFSSASNGSPQVLREVERAVAKHVRIVQFRIENVAPTKAMEYFLSSPHWMDASTPPLGAHIDKLASVIPQLLSAPPPADDAGSVAVPLEELIAAGDKKRTRRLRVTVAAAATSIAVAAAAIVAGVWLMRGPASVDSDAAAIAVLPFENLSHDPAADYLSLAMPAELDSQLTRTTTAIVRPLDSVKHYKDENWSAPDVAKALHVGTIISGSFLHADQQLRMSVNIIDTHQNRQAWSESFQVAFSDLMNLFDNLIHRFAEALRLRMQSGPDDRLSGTSKPEAYDLYLRGLALEQDITDANNNSAIRLLRQAVSIDPGFARGQAALAEAYVTRFWWNFSNDPMWSDLAESAAREALRLDPTSPDAQVALGYALEAKGHRREAMAQYFASVWSAGNFLWGLDNAARYAFYMGDFQRALTTLDKIATIDPGKNVHVRRAMCFYFSGQLDASRSENQEAEKHAQGVGELTLVAFTYVWLKEFDAAERVLQRIKSEHPEQLTILEIEAWLATVRGQTDEARTLMQQIIAQRTTFGIMDEVATLYAIQGDGEQAIDWLTKAVAAGAPNYAWYSSDFFKALRGDPRYEAILKQLTEDYAAVR